jgi:hypothetical protein
MTCGQDFTGAMKMGLVEEWWSRVRRLPEENLMRCAAAGNQADALYSHGKLAKAEEIYREVLTVRRRVLGYEHPDTLLTANNLANTLTGLGKYVVADAICREVLAVQN